MPSREDLACARLDLMVITHDLFVRLGAGQITVEKAVEELERLQMYFQPDADSIFDRWPNGYIQLGDDETTCWLLERALARLREMSEQ